MHRLRMEFARVGDHRGPATYTASNGPLYRCRPRAVAARQAHWAGGMKGMPVLTRTSRGAAAETSPAVNIGREPRVRPAPAVQPERTGSFRAPVAGSVPAVAFEHVSLAFDDNVVLNDVSFSVSSGRMTILIGACGSGKSVVLKLILGLLKPDAGVIRVHGRRIDTMTEAQLMNVRGDIGMLFQENALFDSLSVEDNVGYRLYEEGAMPSDQVRRRVADVLGLIGLQDYLDRMPSELSGGQRRRVAIARAIAARPRLILFDDPTSGLDPITAKTVDDELIKLRDVEHVTSVLVTHQLPDAFYIATHEAVRHNGQLAVVPARAAVREGATFIMLRNGRIYFEGGIPALKASADPYLKSFLSGWIPPLI
jgi:phospholipid/cholesterol/gamma-HCH transport system ATP-binding protein